MARFRLDLEYVGTRYSGWQEQKNARTVQGALHEAVRRVSERTDFESYGSGRTDAGSTPCTRWRTSTSRRASPPRRCAAP